MKLSFSTKGWGYSFATLLEKAKEFRLQGIELHNVDTFSAKSGPLNPANSNYAVRTLADNGLSVPCLTTLCDIADGESRDANVEEIKRTISRAAAIKAGAVRIRAVSTDLTAEKNAVDVVTETLPFAEKNGVCLVMETMGMYSASGKMRDFLNIFSSDFLGALWDLYHSYVIAGETPDITIKNLGAYVKYVHIKDFDEGSRQFCLLGEGTLPIKEFMKALRSINYDGFISLEWDKKWIEGLDDIDIVLPHFVSYMARFDTLSGAKKHYYENRAKTGKFIWKKESLIDKTFSQVLDKMVEEFPDQFAFKYTTLDYTRTYSEFRDDVDRCARALVALGVKSGSHVAVWASNIPEWYITFWATTKLGAVLVTMNTAYKIHEAEYLLKQSDTHTLVMIEGYRDSNYKEIMAELCPELATKTTEQLHSKRLPFLRNVITVGFRQAGCFTWDEAMEKSSTVPVETVYRIAASVKPNDVCNMQYTSGTTGFPKGVMLTHYNIVNNGKNIGDRMDLSTADRMMIQVPMFHCFGMVLAMTASMTHGATLLPLPYFSPKPALACINREHITAFHGVPTMFIAMLEHPDFPKTDFSYMRTGIMAGSPCPISVMQDVVNKMHMTEITIVYGQTEASPGCTMSSTDDSLEIRVGTVGRPLPEIECKIVNPETNEELPDNVTGEFVARGYNIMKGYYKMPNETAQAIDENGWLHTGDLACRTPEGNYRITGRLKDMIIRGGENIYPKEIEEFIYTYPKVKDVQVIGVPDEQYGEEIMACIIPKAGETITVEEIKDYIRTHMAKHKVPRYIDFVTEFPMNVAGKILKYKMRDDAIKKLNLQKAAGIVTA